MDDRMPSAWPDLDERLGCSTLTFSELALRDALDRIAGLGFRCVDIGVSPRYCPHLDPLRLDEARARALGDEIRARGLRVSSLNVNAAGFPARYEGEAEAYLAAGIRVAAWLGAPLVTLQPGAPVPASQRAAALGAAVARFRRLAAVASGAGVRLTLEAPHTGTLAQTYAEAADLFGPLREVGVGCTFDTSHAQRNEARPIADGLAAVGAEVAHVHLRDAYRASYILTPGRGSCDYGPFFEALRSRGYAGDFNLELEGGPVTRESELSYAREYLRAVCRGGPLPAPFAAAKSPRRQFVRLLLDTCRDPKTFITSQPLLRSTLVPPLKALRRLVPVRYARYEAAWRPRWRLATACRVDGGQPPRNFPAAALRVGLLGCGPIGRLMHAPAFARLPGVELVGVCDVQERAARQTAREAGCPAYATVADLVRGGRPDVVANCTPEWVHCDTTIELLTAGVDVFCEKIMADGLARGEAMVRCAAERGRVLAVNFNWRYLPGVLAVRHVKATGQLGGLVGLRVLCHAWVWHHVLDLAGHLAGRPVGVSAWLNREPPDLDRRPWRRFADDLFYLPDRCAHAVVDTAEGVGVSILSSERLDPHGSLFALDALFERGVVSVSGVRMKDARGRVSCSASGVDWGGHLAGGAGAFPLTFVRSVEAFVRAYAARSAPPASGADALRVLRLERAVLDASAAGRRVALEEP